jgi:hypothetical protein
MLFQPPSEFELGAAGSNSLDHARWLEEISKEQEREELALRERCYQAYIAGEADDLGVFGHKRRISDEDEKMHPDSPSQKRART